MVKTLGKQEFIRRWHAQVEDTYHIYEVEDMYNALQLALIDCFTNLEAVKIENVCTIEPNMKPERLWRNPKGPGMITVPSSGSLKIRTATYLKRLFKGKLNDRI
jgi:nucleoid DNA-binding protein